MKSKTLDLNEVETSFQYNGSFDEESMVVVTGNHAKLGNWSPFEGIKMEKGYSKVGVYWFADAVLPKDFRLEYKFVELIPRWEARDNHIRVIGEES